MLSKKALKIFLLVTIFNSTNSMDRNEDATRKEKIKKVKFIKRCAFIGTAVAAAMILIYGKLASKIEKTQQDQIDSTTINPDMDVTAEEIASWNVPSER